MRTLLVLFAACVSVFAADLPTTAQTNGLRGTLYFTDTNVFGGRTNGIGLPRFRMISKIKRGDWFTPAVVFAGPGVGPDGTANVRLGLVVHKPDGSVLQEIEIWATRARFSPSDKTFHLAQDSQTILIGPDEPAGVYIVTATLRDKVKNVTLSLGRSFTIEK